MRGAQLILLTDTLVNGPIGTQRYMGPYAVAAACERAGYDSLVIDYFTRKRDFFAYLENFLTPDLLAVGLSSTFLFPTPPLGTPRPQRSSGLDWYYKGELWYEDGADLNAWLLELKTRIQRKSPRAKIVLGGVKAQFALWRRNYYAAIDHVVFGAGDEIMPDILGWIAADQPVREIEVQGFKVVDNRESALKTGGQLCPPSPFASKWAVQPGESLPIEIARGCIFNCKFCHYEKKKSLKKEIAVLKEEMTRNYELFGTQVYHFCDDCFNDHREKVEKFCEAFLSLGFPIEWVAYARVDVAVKFPETAALMVESGARGLYWGLESFNHQAALKAGKGTPPEQVKEFLIHFHEKFSDRCLTEGSFIVGLPGETEPSLQETLDWVIQNPALDLVTIGSLGLMPYTSSLDNLVFDYADYSRNPAKYGFKKVTFRPSFWEHETMDSVRAEQLATSMSEAWRAARKPGFMRSIWLYPHLRTLGFDHRQIFAAVRDGDQKEEFAEETRRRFAAFLEGYFHSLQRAARPLQESTIPSCSAI